MPDPSPALEELERLRAIEQEAQPGPWAVFESHGRDASGEGWSECVIRPAEGGAAIALTYLTDVIEPDDDGANERFIVTARTAMPRLLRCVDAVLKLADELDAEAPSCRAGCNDRAVKLLREAIVRELTGKRLET